MLQRQWKHIFCLQLVLSRKSCLYEEMWEKRKLYCMQYIQRPTNSLWVYGYNFAAYLSQTWFGHSNGHYALKYTQITKVRFWCFNIFSAPNYCKECGPYQTQYGTYQTQYKVSFPLKQSLCANHNITCTLCILFQITNLMHNSFIL